MKGRKICGVKQYRGDNTYEVYRNYAAYVNPLCWIQSVSVEWVVSDKVKRLIYDET